MTRESSITEHLNQVRARITLAAKAAGRPADSVRLLAVSKTWPASDLRATISAGQLAFGESYLQEALAKQRELAGFPLEWHFIGAIQSNKTRDIAGHFAWVHGVDRLKIAQRLSEQRPSDLPALNICLQVNVDAEASKGGVSAEQLAELAEQTALLPNLRLRGLMCLPRERDDFASQRQPFRLLWELFQSLQSRGLVLDTLSMGMSGDLEAAIAEGATIVRVGSDIFGERDHKN